MAPLSGKFHSLNEITWELEQGVSSRAELTFSPPKYAPSRSRKHLRTSTHTHIYTHTIKAVFQFHHQWLSVLSSIHLITRQIQSVVTAHIKSQPGLATACIPLPLWIFLEAILRQVSSGCMCDRSVLFVCGSLFGSQQRCWSGRVSAWQSMGTQASQERSITTSDMCQVYYVHGFIELIYFVAVGFNQGQFMHTGWADGGGTLVLEWTSCDSKSGGKQWEKQCWRG